MSLLSEESNSATKIEREALILKSAPLKLTRYMFAEWERGMKILWEGDNAEIQARLDAIGTDAAELFQLNSDMQTFLVTQLTGKRDDLVQIITNQLSSLPAFTVNQDGTVILD